MPAELSPAQRAEEDRAIIREAMAALGSRSTLAKRRAARQNGRKGGRPSKTTLTNSKPRKDTP